ncbi:hypothetical protein BGX31_005989 [Mortierella sp. GBA43]|nr:hypothetical protein BGX31_005989 [Mortierella sp. GBA43]
MVFGGIVTSPRSVLTPLQALELAKIYLENAYRAADANIALVLCHDTEVSLSQAKRSTKNTLDLIVRQRVGLEYIKLGKLLHIRGHQNEAQVSYKKAEKLGVYVRDHKELLPGPEDKDGPSPKANVADIDPSRPPPGVVFKLGLSFAKVPQYVFPANVRPPTIEFRPSEPDTRLSDTPQLACCLGLLQASQKEDDVLDPTARAWVQVIKNEPDERERLKTLATDVIRAFKRDEFKDSKAVTEVVFLAPILEHDDFRYLVKEFYSGIDQSGLLDAHQLVGLAQLIQGADPDYLDSDDLVKILTLLSKRLSDTHKQSTAHKYQLTLAVSHVLDAMADAKVQGLDREKLHEPLSTYLDGLKDHDDPYLVYQAAYAYQALLYVPDNETPWQATIRRTGAVIKGVSGFVAAARALDLKGFIEGLEDIQQGLSGVTEVFSVVKTAYEGAAIAEALLQDLRTNGDVQKQTLFRTCRECGPGNHPLKVAPLAMGSPSLLDRVQERPDVEGQLRQLRRIRLKERGNAVFIPPQAKANSQARDEVRFPLMEKVQEFLSGDQTVFLLLGDSGAGKSTFNRELETQLWQSYKKKNGVIPLYINLPALDKPEHDMIAKQLRKVEFTEPQIRELKSHRTFVLVCDGYDESHQTKNLYKTNRLNEPGEWKAKIVISCRSEYLGVDYRDRFQPGDRNQRSESELYQEAVIAPFSMDQVQDYINQYVYIHRPLWEAAEYKAALDLIPSLKDLVRNPFLMTLSLEVLPRMMDPGQDMSNTHITRVALYDEFIEHWLERGKKRLGEKNLSPQARAAFESLSDEGFTQNGIDYLKKLSVAIYKEQGGQPMVQYSRYKDEGSWKSQFFSREDEKQLLREACPLIRNGNQHRFIHRSLLEYGVALAVFDPQDWKERMVVDSIFGRRGSTSSTSSTESLSSPEKVPTQAEQGLDSTSPLVWRNFVNDPSVIQFLEERVQQEPLFRKTLHEYIERSKTERKWRKAAANAITILVRAGVQFIRADLRGIQIPRADISYGIFDGAQLQEADLKQANIRGGWLRQANMTGARMTGVQFGEFPYLKHDSEPVTGTYSPDGTHMAVGFYEGQVCVYSTSEWENIWIAHHHTERVRTIVYSPNGKQIASCSVDSTIRLWDAETGTPLHALTEHTSEVKSVAYSPQGDLLLSACRDWTAKLWDPETGLCLHTFTGHRDLVTRAGFSPKDNGQIATSSCDETVRIWNIKDGECLHLLSGHLDAVQDVVYSPQGDIVASCSSDQTVRLWDENTGNCLHVLTGHTSWVIRSGFSPNGEQLASVGGDKTVRVWDVETGLCLHKLIGHSRNVSKVAFSPQSDLIVSSSDDTTAKLWDIKTGVCIHTLTGHTAPVSDVIFSPKGDQIASFGFDMTARLWDVGTGAARHVGSGYSGGIWMVKCTQKGDYIATCSSDMTVRIFDTETGGCRHLLRGHIETVFCADFSPAGDYVVSGSGDKTSRIWSVDTGACIHTLTGHEARVTATVYSPEGDRLATSSDDHTVRLWDPKLGTCLMTMEGHTGPVIDLVYSRDGFMLASGSEDHTIRLWDSNTGECIQVFTGHTDKIWRLDFSPQGNFVASSSEDCTVRLWNMATGECRHTFVGHSQRVFPLTYSPDGRQIASGSLDGAVMLWDTETGECIAHLDGHKDEIDRVLFSPRGDMLITCSDDQTVRLWDPASGRCLAVVEDFQGAAQDVAWIETSPSPLSSTSSTDDASGHRYLIAGSHDGSVMLCTVIMKDDGACEVVLRWRTTNGGLNLKDAIIQDVRGLSQLNHRLLKQRGAVGEPLDRLRDATKKITKLASALSMFRVPTRTATEGSTPAVGRPTSIQVEHGAHHIVVDQTQQQQQEE